MSIEVLIHFLIATAIVTVIPGPNILLITTDSIRYGVKKSMMTVMGVSAGMIPLFALSLAGISTLLIQSPWLFDVLKLAGVIYLLYLGITQVLDTFKTGKAPQSEIQSKNNFFARGFLISATNPKGLFFASAFFPQFLSKETPMIPQVLMLCGGCLLVASLIGMLYAVFADTANELFKAEKFQKRTTLFSGLIFIFFGVGLFLTQLPDMF